MKRSGFTLVELLVAIALFSIVVVIASSGFVSALRTQRQVASLISTQSNMTLVLEQMAREVRTGYLFCHELSTTNPNNDPGNSDYCGCTVSDSGQHADPGTPAADVYSGNGNGDLSTWTCNALDYYNAQNGHVNYSLRDGMLVKSDSSAADPTAQSITGNDVSVKYLQFTLFGNLEGDQWTPRVTIAIGATPSSTDPAVASDVLNLQTTVSARQIDCGADGSC
jgi:prepilin-type N-terminal cleavage/methylation domain-containing protein